MASPDQPTVGTDRFVVDTVVDLVGRGSYRNARLQLATHERRAGLRGVAELVGRITAPPASIDARTESTARANVPTHLPDWLRVSVPDEISRICARQAMRDERADTLIARILAASIVDESAASSDLTADFARRAHLDLRDDGPLAAVVDVSDQVPRVAQDGDAATPQARRPDRSLTDWLARRN